METTSRTWTKAICWQGLGLFSMAIVGALFTGSFVAGGIMAAINASIGLMVYVLYERLWNQISWGRSPAGKGN